jgi:Raf kinase inhibitor-like YbhB/YbcL family protein
MSYDPYALAFPVPAFPVRSSDFADGGALPQSCYSTANGANESPALAWGPLPEGTRSIVVTAYDPDAPIPGGLWHWAVKDIPAAAPGLVHGAGTEKAPTLPAGAIQLTNDLGQTAYSGVQPPPGTGTHRLVICVTALAVDTLDIPERASLALVNILMISHTLGRGIIVATSQAPEA